MTLDEKLSLLRNDLAALPSVLVAFSGGVDSSFLLRVAYDVLGDRCIALTTVSPSTPEHDLADARALASGLGVRHVIIDTNELAIAEYAANPINRCYFCKDNLFTICVAEAQRLDLAGVIDGANLDDLSDHRPGLQAASERGIRHPLVDAGLTKADIRAASHDLGLTTWDRPSSPCLASRFPYGTALTAEKLRQVGRAEQSLHALGFTEVRVRFHDAVARLEVPLDDMPRVLDPAMRERIVGALREAGFAHVTLDLRGLRSGSLNEGVVPKAIRTAT